MRHFAWTRCQNGKAANGLEQLARRGLWTALFLSLCASGIVLLFPKTALGAADTAGDVAAAYQAYERRFASIATIADISEQGYEVVEKHVFDVPLVPYITVETEGDESSEVELHERTSTEVVRPERPYHIGAEDAVALQQAPTVRFFTAIEKDCHRAAVFLADAEGDIVYKTNQLECNYAISGRLEQPIVDMISVAFQDLDGDGLMDIILIAGCVNETGAYAGKTYKVGEVLFQTKGDGDRVSFYRDWRINDKINRFDMNRSAKCIRSFVRDGRSAEFLYTATTESELLENGFAVIKEQSYWRNYEKLGKLKVLPGIFSIADYDVFMIYMINEQGDIVWSFQPMGDYDNLYSLRGVSGKDLDGDGMKDLLVVGRYSREGESGEMIVEGRYSIYYQRTGGFDTDVEFVRDHPYRDDCTVEELGNEIRAYWGWNTAGTIFVSTEGKRND